ncbi:MAG TPA: MBL fold metallo-hydrolase [Pseudonocardiaceae bacterium]|jgi:L-ascorbate metabolism protein UlaG (beta-lactamase superfamily)|nr:MBL fold metallo-hydrolase [Pseudonocardiaceae bacterium]
MGTNSRTGRRRRPLWRRLLRLALTIGAVGVAALAVRDVPAAIGARPSGATDERVRRSPQFRDGAFRNVARTSSVPPPGTGMQALRAMFTDRASRRPAGPIPLVNVQPPAEEASATGLHVTWYGHASALVEVDGARILIDPVWGERVSPSALVGPRRLHEPPVAVEDLPALDAIVISHDHYDHLDLPTVRSLLATQRAPFVVPLGVGAHLRQWQVPEQRIIELDWTEQVELAGITLVSTAAQHFSGRLFARDGTLWSSWVIAGPLHRIFYTGDSGYFDGYAAIGAQHGPFDLTLVQIGAYNDAWPDIHMTPEQGAAAHLDLRGGLLVPVHWATFTLAPHAWTEPVDRLWAEAKAHDITLAVPRPGERIRVATPPAVDGWWQALG